MDSYLTFLSEIDMKTLHTEWKGVFFICGHCNTSTLQIIIYKLVSKIRVLVHHR
ncbi:hypothetical protein AALP_AA3G196900 [Arabis alpina]|uniref:Uncharacterized protein n=1 Tax=Arabis alpina TaxID=50452 RepID=A0A087HAB8_ARAAL|nr:hypothetical protein AALP_AA3G196900 [Arabis alpina]